MVVFCYLSHICFVFLSITERDGRKGKKSNLGFSYQNQISVQVLMLKFMKTFGMQNHLQNAGFPGAGRCDGSELKPYRFSISGKWSSSLVLITLISTL